ncbi:MAG TPA: MCE family protein, partial [Desulfobacterales bacterium]|nr:MCE family protein [Desulfobacterales bacterium]
MTSKKQQFYVGLFMVTGLAIALVALVWLGLNRYFEEGRLYAAYFDQSVQGLTIDSPVKYRGVTVGRVKEIAVAPDARLIMVVMLLDTGIDLEEDIVAQLKVVGITGSMFIELDRATPEDLARSPKLDFPSRYPIIASKPSEISEIFRGIDEIVDTINRLDLAGLAERAKTLLDTANSELAAMRLAATTAKLRDSLDAVNRLLDSEQIQALVSDSRSAIKSLERAVDTAGATFASADDAVQEVKAVLAENRAALNRAITALDESLTSMRAVL